MAKSVEEFNKSRLRSSNITVVISITLVLFLSGLFGLILINAQRYTDNIKELLVVNAFFDENFKPEDSVKINQLEKEAFETIKKMPFVNKATFITRQMAAEEAKKDMGVNSQEIFDANIFPPSVEVSLKADYVADDKINGVIKELSTVKGIKTVKNNTEFTAAIYNNLDRILKWILGFSLMFLVLAVVIINNSIRLKIFSKRFTIKTMQLVGAKRRFILKPFIKEAMILGFIGGIVGLAVLMGVWYYFTQQIQSPFVVDEGKFILLVVSILILGVLITTVSTIAATWRFMKTSVDDLYYS